MASRFTTVLKDKILAVNDLFTKSSFLIFIQLIW